MGLSAHPARMLASSTEKGLCFRSFLASAKAAGWVRMLSWDDFRYVKAIADPSRARASTSASTFHGVPSARPDRAAPRLAPVRARPRRLCAHPLMVDLAERMFQEIVGFERRVTGQDLRPSGNCGSPPATSSSGIS